MGKNKAAALASYAKQAGDETVHRYADRIKARAVRLGGGAGEADCASDRCSSKEGGRPPSFTQASPRTNSSRRSASPHHESKPAQRAQQQPCGCGERNGISDCGYGIGRVQRVFGDEIICAVVIV